MNSTVVVFGRWYVRTNVFHSWYLIICFQFFVGGAIMQRNNVPTLQPIIISLHKYFVEANHIIITSLQKKMDTVCLQPLCMAGLHVLKYLNAKFILTYGNILSLLCIRLKYQI